MSLRFITGTDGYFYINYSLSDSGGYKILIEADVDAPDFSDIIFTTTTPAERGSLDLRTTCVQKDSATGYGCTVTFQRIKNTVFAQLNDTALTSALSAWNTFVQVPPWAKPSFASPQDSIYIPVIRYASGIPYPMTLQIFDRNIRPTISLASGERLFISATWLTAASWRG
jgi:hypothetical protein